MPALVGAGLCLLAAILRPKTKGLSGVRACLLRLPAARHCWLSVGAHFLLSPLPVKRNSAHSCLAHSTPLPVKLKSLIPALPAARR